MAYQRKPGGAPKERRPFLYHSQLVTAGPSRVTVDSEPRLIAKLEKHAVDLTLAADGTKVSYLCENDRSAEFFKGQVGSTFTVVASGGSKDNPESATLTATGVEQQQAAPPTQQQAPAVSVPAATWPKLPAGRDPLAAMKVFVGRNESIVKIGLSRFCAVLLEFKQAHGEELPIELYEAVFTGLVYGSWTERGSVPACIDLKTLQPKAGAARPQQAAPTAGRPPAPSCPKHHAPLRLDGGCEQCMEEAKPKCPACGAALDDRNQCPNADCLTKDDVPF